ncbi:MAG: transposase [Rhodanobacteraceae bacterium]|nr:transposase [Rhodanobacteraceae bacterium]
MSADDLHQKLAEFRYWYNHTRPHQHLCGRTPAEVWTGRKKATGTPYYFSGWDGQLAGWYFPG